jgi:hypothetical protein
VAILPRAASVLFLASLLHAPVQCARKPDAALCIQDDPAETLYDLAASFHEKGNESARRETLEHLVKRYPSSRFAVRAQDELGAPTSSPANAPTLSP